MKDVSTHDFVQVSRRKGVPKNCLNKANLKLIYAYNISSLVSIRFVENIRKLRRRACAKLLQTLLTIGEGYFCVQTILSL